MLQRGRIDEAEKFAEKWNLNAEPVWKARARIVADKTTCADFDHFATILNQIKDVKFIVDCCMDVNIPDVVNAKKLYGYCQRRLRASMASNPNDKRIWKLLGKVSELSKRLDLYSFLVTDSSVFSDEWERFSGCNLVEYSRKLVETGELQKSTMVLLRVEEEQIKEVFRSRENVLNYLEAAPNKTDINDIVVWFRSIFNCITNAVPDSLPFFISWLTMRLQRLENVPEKAITFAEGILEAIRLDGGETSLSVSPALDHVQNIVSCLHQINHLRSSHHITVSLSEFLEGGTALVSYLLTSVDVSDIRLLYSDFLLPYMRRHQLAPDETLSAYINEISETEGGLWESRAAQIIPCIPSTTTRLRTLISTLHYVELPWTATITALVDDVLRNTTHPLCDEIRQSRDDIPFRILLRKHFRRLNVPLSLSNFQVFQIASKVLRSPDDPTDDFEVLIRKFPKLSAKLKAQLVVSRHEDTQTEGLIRAMSQDELRTCFVMLNSGDDDGLDTGRYGSVVKDVFLKMFFFADIMRLVYERIANVPAVFTKWMAEAERTREYRVPAKKLHDVVSESFDRSDWDATVKRICRTARQFGYRECDAAFELARQTSGNLTVIIAILENVSDEMTWEEDLQLVRLAIWSCCEDEDEMDGDVSQDLSNSMNTTLAKFATVDEQKRGEGTKKCLRTAEKFVHLAVEKGGVSEACEVARWLRMLTAMDDVVALAIARDAFAALPGTPDWIGASQLGEFIESLPLRLQGVQIDLSILQLLQTMSVTVRNTAWHSHIENFQNALVPLVLNKLLRTDSRYVVLFILKHMTHGQALSWFKHALTQNRMDLQSLAAGARLALSYVQSIPRSPAAEVGYRDIVLRCKWWERCFATMNVSLTYSEHFQVPPERLVEILVESDVGTLSTITELCDDYKINHKKFLPKYLRNFLIRWRPNGSDTVDDLVKQCRNVIAQIDDETVTTKLLQTICDQISYYRYETFMCIMKLLSDKQEVNALLLFLREYKRISKPSQGEVEEWMKWFPNTPELDPLASTRLPYLPVETLLQDDWRILRPEVTLDTYPTWFNAMHIIGLNKNDICTYAIKNAILTGVLGRVGDGTWLLERQHPDIVEKIAECASSMSNYEMATAVLFQAMLHTAGGADQCDLARHCWETCRKWMATGNAPEESVERVWNKYLSCHTEHILQENNLVNEKYLKLLSQPQQLVLLLYQDERIVRRNAFDRISINEAVDKIGSVHEIDVTKLREDIIEQTLQTESTDCAHRRICYICESPRDEPWTAFLSNYHNAPNALPIRVLALRCMSTLLGPNFTSTQHLETLQFLHRLQGVGVSFSENEFAATSKPDLVRKLSKLQSPNAIHLAVDLSNDYSLQDPILWENILRSRSLDLLPAKTLRDILARLGRLKHVATGSTYLIVWARLITRIVSSSVANDTNWAFAFSLLLYCPDMSRVDLRKLAENCVQRERPEVAVCLAMYMEEDARKETFNVSG